MKVIEVYKAREGHNQIFASRKTTWKLGQKWTETIEAEIPFVRILHKSVERSKSAELRYQ